jgi:SAM-dependent methyltransferase
MQALPASGRLTAIEARGEYAEIAARFLSPLAPTLETRVGDALEELSALEREGRQFDFISIDADKQQQQAYYEACLRLLRPRGLLVMFGMMLYPTEEDKEAIDGLISLVANDTRVTTTMLPIGCGVQVCTKKGERLLDGPLPPPANLPPRELRRYELEAELTAIDMALADAERNRASGGHFDPHPPPAAPAGLKLGGSGGAASRGDGSGGSGGSGGGESGMAHDALAASSAAEVGSEPAVDAPSDVSQLYGPPS